MKSLIRLGQWLLVSASKRLRRYKKPPPQRYDVQLLSRDLRQVANDIRTRKYDIHEHQGLDEWPRVVFKDTAGKRTAYVDKAFATIHYRELLRKKCEARALCHLRSAHRGLRYVGFADKIQWWTKDLKSLWITWEDYQVILYDMEKKYLLQRPTRFSSITAGNPLGVNALANSIAESVWP